MSQKIIVTTLPWKDYKTGKSMLSAFMSIQLEAAANTKLSSFPDIIKWMEKIEFAKFYIQWNGAKPVTLQPKTTKWDKALYTKLFHEQINVKSFSTPDISNLIIKSYPSLHLQNFILDAYKEVGNLKSDVLPDTKFFTTEFKKLDDISPVQLKQTQPLTNRAGNAGINDFIIKGNIGQQTVRQGLKQNKTMPFSAQPNAKIDIGQFQNFHAQPDKVISKSPPVIAKPEFEYHDMLSIITSYPVIMRKLGLVLDFELPSVPSANGTVRIIPANLNFENDVTINCPNTKYISTAIGFYAEAKAGSSIDKGVLKINTNEFSVVQIDTDGAAMKLANHTETINYKVAQKLVTASNYIAPISFLDNDGNEKPNNAKEDKLEEKEEMEGLPALRTAGIGIAKNGLAKQLSDKLTANLDLHKSLTNVSFAVNSVSLFNKTTDKATIGKPITTAKISELNKAIEQPLLLPAADKTLYADDIVFGYKMDVAYDDEPNKWYSLHKRKNTYAFVPAGGAEQSIALHPEDEIDEGCINIALTEDENDKEQPQKITEVIARWEGWSLSVPRIGKAINNDGANLVSSDEEEKKKYKIDKDAPFRLQVNTNPAPRTLPMLRYGKSYRLKIRTVDIAGNSLPHDVTPENISAAVKSGIKHLRYEPLPVPVLLPGDEVTTGDKTKMRDRDGESVEHMVIRSNVGISAEQYEKNNSTAIFRNTKPVALNEKRPALTNLTYLHEAVRHVIAPRTSQLMAETHGMFDEAFKDPAKAKDAYNFITSHDKETVFDGKIKADVIPVTQKQVDIPFIADPMAAGVVFTMVSNTTFETSWKANESRKFSFYFDDEVADGNVNTAYTPMQWRTPRSFRIKLIEGNAAPSWDVANRIFIIQLPKSAQIEIKYACFWRPADIDKYSAMQQVVVGSNLSSRAGQHARKGLHWMFSPWRTIRLVHAVQQPLSKPVILSSEVKRDYNDTFVSINTKLSVSGSSTDKVDVEAQWNEWVDDLADISPKQIAGKTHVDTVMIFYTDKEFFCNNIPGSKPHKERRPGWLHRFGDTKHRMVNYNAVATTRYREYFTGIIETAKNNGINLQLTQNSDTLTLNILSSARPTVPVVDYVVPSFNWLKTKAGNVETHLRTGNIRVYMKRPWYSSGDDEKIAVIVPVANMPASVQQKYCTVWGKDPVFIAPELNNSNYPAQEHFPNAEAYKKLGFDKYPLAAEHDTVTLAEGEGTIKVAAHKVLFDEEKQLHYADIPIYIAQAYFPFVKLSLARYQKNSLRLDGTDCCLSNVVYTDWMQVVPTRATQITPVKGSSGEYDVIVRGTASSIPGLSNPALASNGVKPVRTRITITVENSSIPKTDETFVSINARTSGIATTDYIKQKDLAERDFKNGQIEFIERVPVRSAGSRIVIREFELHEADPIRTKEKQKAASFTGNTPAYTPEFTERLVFMDVFEV